MRKARGIAQLATLVVLVGTAVGVAALPAAAVSTTYYVDATAGSDSAAGTSAATAWKTLAKVDATTFGAGDQILFKKGQTWAGQLHPLGSGSAASPITISSYGTGAAPIIDGSGLASGPAVYLKNQSNWTIQNLEVTNNVGSSNFGTLATPGTSRDGIRVVDNGGGVVSGITIKNNTVHDVSGCFNCSDVDAHDNGGIIVYAMTGSDSFNGVNVTGNTVTNVGRTGITVWDESYYTTDPYTMVQSQLSTNVVIAANTVKNIDSDGIIAFGTEGAMLDHNVVGNAGQKTISGSTEPSAAGLWPTRAMDSTVQYNEVYGTLTQSTDGQGFDNDYLSVNSKFQYNYSHDNQGGFLLMMGYGSTGTLVRDNLIVNDGWGGVKGIFDFSYGVQDGTQIYNNTVYIPSGSTENISYCDGGVPTSGTWSFRNNIIENHGAGTYCEANPSGATIDSNVFYGNHPASEFPDAHALTTNPQLTSPGTAPYGIASVTGFTIPSTSPAAGSGAVIASNGGRDYFGRTVSATAAPSRGFYEAQTVTGPPTLIDQANDFVTSASHSVNVYLDSSTPSNMNGDASRYSRTNGSPGTITWAYDGMKQFSATVYSFDADLSTLTFASSPDGITWTAVPSGHTTPVATVGSWRSSVFTPTSNLPTGTRFLKATISSTSAWNVELGGIVISD